MSYLQRLKDKVVLITGASAGLGEQIAYAAAQRGATVVVTARREERLKAVKERCVQLSGAQAFAFPLDVGNKEMVSQVLQQIIDEVGFIDVLVNNAGFGSFVEALDTSTQITEEMFQVNVLGLIQVTHIIGNVMREQGRGHIINVSSQGGKTATPKSAVYAATKFAIRGYSNALRLELKPLGINVTTVNPGPVRTDFFAKADEGGSYVEKLGKWVLDPKDVANRVAESMLTNRREINLPRLMDLGARFYVFFPRLGDYLTSTIFNRK